MNNPSELFGKTVLFLKDLKVKHESYSFPSGAFILDIWINNKFFVLQFDNHYVGISEVNDRNIGFGSEPDEKFYDNQSYWRKLENIVKQVI